MDPATYEKVCALFAELADLPLDERERRLQELSADDEQLASLLKQMLTADSDANRSHFLDDTNDSDLSKTTLFPNAVPGDETMSLVGSHIGEYRIDEQIGAGGMGVVYRAYDLNSERSVAIKLIRAGALTDDEHVKRFRTEAIAAAQMEHPNIVPVFDVGRNQGHEYFTMSLVEGNDLKTVLKDGPLSSRLTAELFVKVANALSYAHKRSVIHRDIKPANIMLRSNKEPLLTDFGIAKRVQSDDDQTSTGQVLGTAVYMAPEQIADSKHVGPSADIYSLGATMYECLTGKPPFEGNNVLQLFDTVCNRLPAPPREARSDIDPDMESICMRCLQKSSDDRYESAEQLVADLERYLSGDPLATTPLSRWKSVDRALKYRSQHGKLDSSGITAWVLGMAVTIHPAIFFLTATDQSPIYLWATLAVWASVAGWVNYRYHWQQYWRLSSAERQSGMIFLAVNISFACLFFIHGPHSASQPSDRFLDAYPPYCLLNAVGLCAHAGIHAGRWMVYGALFVPLALAIAWLPFWGPLLFCLVGTLIAWLIDRDLRSAANSSAVLNRSNSTR